MGGRAHQGAQVSLQSVRSVPPPDVSTKTPVKGSTGGDTVVEPSAVAVVSGGNVAQGEVEALTLRRQSTAIQPTGRWERRDCHEPNTE